MCETISITEGGGSLGHNHRTRTIVVGKSHIDHELTQNNIDWHLGSGDTFTFNHNSDSLEKLIPRKYEGGKLSELSQSEIRNMFRETFNSLFATSVAEYNSKQTRNDRKIKNYYQKINHDKQKKPFTELIVQVGNRDTMGTLTENAPLAKAILLDYINEWQQRNPHLVVADASLHMDEIEGTPHLHIDFIPVATEQKRGLPMQLSLTKALEQQGFKGKGKSNTAYMQWRETERKALESICTRHGVKTKRLGNTEKHLYTPIYKKAKAEESKILGNAQSEAEGIVSHAREQASEITLSAQKAAEERARGIVSKAEERATEIISQAMGEIKSQNYALPTNEVRSHGVGKNKKQYYKIPEWDKETADETIKAANAAPIVKKETERLQQENVQLNNELKRLRSETRTLGEENKTLKAENAVLSGEVDYYEGVVDNVVQTPETAVQIKSFSQGSFIVSAKAWGIEPSALESELRTRGIPFEVRHKKGVDTLFKIPKKAEQQLRDVKNKLIKSAKLKR